MPHVTEADKVLWTEFEAVFQSAWKDTAKMQSVYNQLMKLQMKELNIDTYNTMFERLTSAAEWEPNTKGTIACYRAGLRENVHCHIINRENLPTTMTQWKKLRGRKSAGSKNFKALDLSDHIETSHVTSTHTKLGTNTHPTPCQTTSTSPWTWTLQI
jgi:hypothetical protein